MSVKTYLSADTWEMRAMRDDLVKAYMNLTINEFLNEFDTGELARLDKLLDKYMDKYQNDFKIGQLGEFVKVVLGQRKAKDGM